MTPWRNRRGGGLDDPVTFPALPAGGWTPDNPAAVPSALGPPLGGHPVGGVARRPDHDRAAEVRGGAWRLAVAAALGIAATLGAQGVTAKPARAAGAVQAAVRSHPMIPAPAPQGVANASISNLGWSSENWSGYAVTGGTGHFSAVTGCWSVPAVASSGGSDTFSSAWIGIDGFNPGDDALIQTGTTQAWYEGAAYYEAWWEILPKAATTIESIGVSPGDRVCASITEGTGGDWTISIDDTSDPEPFSTVQPYTGPQTSAEWIVERPEVCDPSCELSTLADYGETTFDPGSVNGGNPGLTADEGGSMYGSSYSDTVSTPSDPDNDTDGFNIVYGSTQPSPPSPAAPATLEVSSAQQYTLSGSDGATWQAVDPTNLSMSFTPTASSTAVLTANADLWTSTAGYNQDIGIDLTPEGGSTVLVAWKESGGFAGTFSPNAAAVQGDYAVAAGTTYTATLVWKSNVPMPAADTIWMGAGGAGAYSPTTLTTILYPVSGSPLTTAVVNRQYTLTATSDDNGTAWRPVDATNVSLTIKPSAGSEVMLTGNADLWTADPGYNQDIGIQVTPAGGSPVVAAWKESGGFAGTYSPNAGFVQALVPLTAGTTYTVELVWKSNVPMPAGDSIWIGAGHASPGFSPTSLFATLYPSASAPASAASSQQYTLQATGADSGAAWRAVDASRLSLTVTPSETCWAHITGNADLWTADAGYNQDIGIQVTQGGWSSITAWKESGGFAGTYSPNASFVQAVYPMDPGITYTIQLAWRANRPMPAGDSIWIGAGGGGAGHSPTTLLVDLTC